MLEVKDCVTPSPDQFRIVIKGMRNAFKSWSKSDSHLIKVNVDSYDLGNREGYIDDKQVDYQNAIDMIRSKDYYTLSWIKCEEYFRIGKNDKRLLTMLTSMGTSDRKALRQLPIILEVKAPLYWWKQADKYQIGTTTNSESTMHTIINKEFEVSDFSCTDIELNVALDYTIDNLNTLRDEYLYFNDLSQEFKRGDRSRLEEYLRDYTKFDGDVNSLSDEQIIKIVEDEKELFWMFIIELLPESYYQTRTWNFNYEVALSIIGQRMFHDLPEWKTLIVFLLNHIPYLLELAVAAGLVRLDDENVIGIKDGKEEVLYQHIKG